MVCPASRTFLLAIDKVWENSYICNSDGNGYPIDRTAIDDIIHKSKSTSQDGIDPNRVRNLGNIFQVLRKPFS